MEIITGNESSYDAMKLTRVLEKGISYLQFPHPLLFFGVFFIGPQEKTLEVLTFLQFFRIRHAALSTVFLYAPR